MNDLESKLEHLVDSATLAKVVRALAHLAAEKADHVLVNWQDESLAREWRRAGKALDAAARKITV